MHPSPGLPSSPRWELVPNQINHAPLPLPVKGDNLQLLLPERTTRTLLSLSEAQIKLRVEVNRQLIAYTYVSHSSKPLSSRGISKPSSRFQSVRSSLYLLLHRHSLSSLLTLTPQSVDVDVNEWVAVNRESLALPSFIRAKCIFPPCRT